MGHGGFWYNDPLMPRHLWLTHPGELLLVITPAMYINLRLSYAMQHVPCITYIHIQYPANVQRTATVRIILLQFAGHVGGETQREVAEPDRTADAELHQTHLHVEVIGNDWERSASLSA